MIRTSLFLASLSFAALMLASAEARQEEGDRSVDEAIGNCVRVTSIRRTDILNDRTILLEMKSGPAILMHLKHACPQLAFHDYFRYEARLGQLCAEIDHIVSRAGFQCDIGGFSRAMPEKEAEGGAGPDA